MTFTLSLILINVPNPEYHPTLAILNSIWSHKQQEGEMSMYLLYQAGSF